MLDIAILGASGFARQIAWTARRSGNGRVIAFIDETISEPFDYDGVSVLPSLDGLKNHDGAFSLVSAVGDPELRRRWAREYGSRLAFATVVDPAAIVADKIKLGEGCVVLAGSILSTEVSVGDHSILGYNVCVSHEATVGSFTHLAGGVILNGMSKVGNGCRIGAGAIILPGIEVGDDAIVGAGATVTKNVLAGTSVAGVPARKFRQRRT